MEKATPNDKLAETQNNPQNAGNTPLPQASKRSWRKYLIYFFAFLGILALALVAFGVVYERSKPVKATINEVEMLETLMSRAYGKYSEQRKGWLYVDENNQTYVMRVIQHAKPEDGANGDELYFIASGSRLGGEPGALYGVFQVRLQEGSKDGTLVEVSSPYRYEGDVAITPEQVKFEAFSANVWGWVIKVQEGTDPKLSSVRVQNIVLAPHGDEIALLATFMASEKSDPGIPCEEAKRLHDIWENPPAVPTADETDVAKDEENASEGEESIEPMRCSAIKWTFKTGSISGQAFTPIYVTRKGMLDGENLPEKTWKLIFDNKSYIYIVPSELEVKEEPYD